MTASILQPPAGQAWLDIDLAAQRLELRQDDRTLLGYTVASALAGPGELEGSGCTPRGWHCIRAMIGAGAAPGAVFVGRRPTGEIYSEQLARRFPRRDWILTRIIWLSGLEPGRNRLGKRDTMRRYIYIHGCPDTVELGQPGSKGCIRMRNLELIELFDRVAAGMRVYIHE